MQLCNLSTFSSKIVGIPMIFLVTGMTDITHDFRSKLIFLENWKIWIFFMIGENYVNRWSNKRYFSKYQGYRTGKSLLEQKYSRYRRKRGWRPGPWRRVIWSGGLPPRGSRSGTNKPTLYTIVPCYLSIISGNSNKGSIGSKGMTIINYENGSCKNWSETSIIWVI